MREQGSRTLLPHLTRVRLLANFLRVRSAYEARHGNIDQALALVRLQFELGRKMGEEPIPISGLVANGILAAATLSLGEVMNQPDSPNLYWALASLPRPLVKLQHSMEDERISLTSTFPELSANRIEDMSVDQWHRVFKGVVADVSKNNSDSPPSAMGWANDQTVADEVTRFLPQAAAWYGPAHHLSTDQVEQIDSFKVVVRFWYEQCQEIRDDEYKLTALPYPIAIMQMNRVSLRLKQLTMEEPANAFFGWLMDATRMTQTLARGDRVLAALTDVEAIRSYAAANGGKLPASLDDISDTPAMDNPRTGKPFNYQIKGDVATLSDGPILNSDLIYTIHIRQ